MLIHELTARLRGIFILILLRVTKTKKWLITAQPKKPIRFHD